MESNDIMIYCLADSMLSLRLRDTDIRPGKEIMVEVMLISPFFL